jgi:hypothetical protein
MAVRLVSDIELPNSIRLTKDAELPHQRLVTCKFKMGLNFVPEYVSDSWGQKLSDGYKSWYDFGGRLETDSNYRLQNRLEKGWEDYFSLDNDIRDFSPSNSRSVIFVYLHLSDHILGMMVLSFNHNSMIDDEPLLHLEYIEANPKFSKEIMSLVKSRGIDPKDIGMPSFSVSGVGTALIRYAINLSIFYRYRGRLQLYALREAEAFYLALGMVKVPDSSGIGIMEFTELSAFECLKL